jgi:hypothetical protein
MFRQCWVPIGAGAGAAGAGLDVWSIWNTCGSGGGPAGASCGSSFASLGAELATRKFDNNVGNLVDLVSGNFINVMGAQGGSSPYLTFSAGYAV